MCCWLFDKMIFWNILIETCSSVYIICLNLDLKTRIIFFFKNISECDVGRYGVMCLGRCFCNGHPCDRVNGLCNCSAGYTGVTCEQRKWVTC